LSLLCGGGGGDDALGIDALSGVGVTNHPLLVLRGNKSLDRNVSPLSLL